MTYHRIVFLTVPSYKAGKVIICRDDDYRKYKELYQDALTEIEMTGEDWMKLLEDRGLNYYPLVDLRAFPSMDEIYLGEDAGRVCSMVQRYKSNNLDFLENVGYAAFQGKANEKERSK